MPWHCPACQSEIRHRDHELKPLNERRYRCHVCRLELVFDMARDHLVVAPIDEPPSRIPPPTPKRAA